MKKKINSWIKATIEEIFEKTLLPPTTFRIVWSLKSHPEDEDIEATIQYDLNKKIAKLVIYPPFVRYWQQGKRDYLREVLIHELAHLHTAEINRIALSGSYTTKEIEEAVERLACVLTKYIKEIIKRKIKMQRISFYDFD
jgi:hypothetical protein